MCDEIDDVQMLIADSPKSTNTRVDDPIATYHRCLVPGRASQMNEGVMLANNADILCFLHADVRPPLDFVPKIKAAINSGNGFGFFAYDFDPSNFWLRINARFTGHKGIFAGGGDQIHFMTRETFDLLGGYNPKYSIMEDFDLVRRVKSRGVPYAVSQSRAIVSSRKYDQNSWLKVNLYNLMAFLLFHIGIDSSKIKSAYNRGLKISQ